MLEVILTNTNNLGEDPIGVGSKFLPVLLLHQLLSNNINIFEKSPSWMLDSMELAEMFLEG